MPLELCLSLCPAGKRIGDVWHLAKPSTVHSPLWQVFIEWWSHVQELCAELVGTEQWKNSPSFVKLTWVGRGGSELNTPTHNVRGGEEGKWEWERQTPWARGSLYLNCLCHCLRDGQGGFPTKGPSEQARRWSEGVDLTSPVSGVSVSWAREQQVRRTVSKITFWNWAFCILECTVSTLASEITLNSDLQSQRKIPREELEFRQFENKDKILYRGSFEIRDFLKFSVHTIPQILQVLGKIRSVCSLYRQFLKHREFRGCGYTWPVVVSSLQVPLPRGRCRPALRLSRALNLLGLLGGKIKRNFF